MKNLRLALWPAALGAAGATAALVLTGGLTERPALTVTVGLLVGLSWSLIGLEEWRRRPMRRIGALMVLLGFAWFGSLLVYSDISALHTTGLFLRPLFIAVLGHLLLAFPTGCLQGGLSRAIVIAAYVDTIAVNAASVVFHDPAGNEVRNLALLDANTVLAEAFRNAARGIGVALILVSLVVLAHRWRHATPPWRRAVAPVMWCGAAAAAAGALRLFNDALDQPLGPIESIFFVVLATVPLAFEVGLLRSRLARGAVAQLIVELDQTRTPGGLREALARALHDPSLDLAYWLPAQRRYVNVNGNPVRLPQEGASRVATVVEREGRRVAALVHDGSLREDPGLVEAVSAAAGLALENERLQAELRARLDELRASRARIVESADDERRRIERNLHDGTQQRLVSVSMALGLAESKLPAGSEARPILAHAREALSVALQELRELSHGIHPGILVERGLPAALQEFAYVAPVPIELNVQLQERLPQPVEAVAYYVVAEALANVAKYACATAVTVCVERRNGHVVVEVADDGVGGADPTRGSGLRGLGDRVEALDGAFSIDSRPDAGTRVRAEIPCAS
jgi:signal transduction histidine kinase